MKLDQISLPEEEKRVLQSNLDYPDFFSGPNLVMHECLLVTIKIQSHILFETTALKCAVKGKGFFALKEQKQRLRVSQLMKNIRIGSDWLRVALLLSEISRSMACSALHGKDRTMLMLL